MMKLCVFLKSKEGSEFLDNFQKKAELSTRFKYIDTVNTGYRYMLMDQLSEFEAARKERTAKIEADIADHRSKIVLLEKQLEKEIAEIERRYFPCSSCRKNEEMMRELDQELIEFIKYEKEVHMLHISDFMADEKRKLVLIKFGIMRG
ncbi:hypothetical protein TSUD_361080 [Trifolium subterraneum]|uniref:Uncharacterized protein n=1 Tax=Trifolium subterraneum TaxID=3900 RepID=A0A2Z6N5U2_TRISU|nr:hypothetical protein TSUD_361080 [Trifolium subterraneum]